LRWLGRRFAARGVQKLVALGSGQAQRIGQALGQLLRRALGVGLVLAQNLGRAAGQLGQRRLRELVRRPMLAQDATKGQWIAVAWRVGGRVADWVNLHQVVLLKRNFNRQKR
jgi:hypothetical protein